MCIRNDAETIIRQAIKAVLPEPAVSHALQFLPSCQGKCVLIAAGKAAFRMSAEAERILKDHISEGLCITKYGHVSGKIPHVACMEAGHPVPDQNSILATKAAESIVKPLTADDQVVFLLSGGGSALFEDPMISLNELQHLTDRLLKSGASIQEINCIRKRLSHVKGGRFAALCSPAKVFQIVLSDVIGNPLDVIASGPAALDHSTAEEALEIVQRYHLAVSSQVLHCLALPLPDDLSNVATQITGSVHQLVQSASSAAELLGYHPVILSERCTGDAAETGRWLAETARQYQNSNTSTALLAGGETTVQVTGGGTGGRCQHLALSTADLLTDCKDTCIFAVGSDGTDGPTDAAGGYVDCSTADLLKKKGISLQKSLLEYDSYHALQAVHGLLVTGPTGTNVNDLYAALIKR